MRPDDDETALALATGKITIRHVAARAGVSIKTVSRVLNNEPGVRDAVRTSVETAVADLKYRPNISARALAGMRSYLIGLIYDNPSPNYVSQLQLGAMHACREAGYHLMIEQVNVGAPDLRTRVRDAVIAPRLDGVILSPPLSDNVDVMETLDGLDIPYVCIAPDESQPVRGPSVTMDDRRAAAEMTAYLYDQGHRDIGFVAAPREHAAAARRRDGFLTALAERGIAVRPDYIVEGGFTTVSGVEAGLKLLDHPQRPTAIFAANDEMAAGVMIAAYQRSIELPGQLSVAGFDDSPVARALHPLLTTVRQPTVEMAEEAARILIERDRKGRAVLDFELVIRGSVAGVG